MNYCNAKRVFRAFLHTRLCSFVWELLWEGMGIFRRKPRPSLGFGWGSSRGLAAALAVTGCFFTGLPVSAQKTPTQPELSLPIRCQPGRDCWLVNRVDIDPGPGIRDYMCSNRSYDGHKGVDLAIRDLVAMKKGVPVVASVGGIVKAARDGMKDIDVTIAGMSSVKGRECGNGIVVSHPGGWETQYCHLRQGSITVKAGDTITRGQALGLVGISGRAQFPHVHLSVRKGKTVIDPFIGLIGPGGRTKACGPGPAPLWRAKAIKALSRNMTALFNAGFATGAPKPRVARSGLLAATRMPRTIPALVLWVDMYWPEAGDQLRFRISGPDGRPFARRTVTIAKSQARRISFYGKKRKGRPWPAGIYRGEVILSRKKGAKGQQGQKETGGALRLTVTREIELR